MGSSPRSCIITFGAGSPGTEMTQINRYIFKNENSTGFLSPVVMGQVRIFLLMHGRLDISMSRAGWRIPYLDRYFRSSHLLRGRIPFRKPNIYTSRSLVSICRFPLINITTGMGSLFLWFVQSGPVADFHLFGKNNINPYTPNPGENPADIERLSGGSGDPPESPLYSYSALTNSLA